MTILATILSGSALAAVLTAEEPGFDETAVTPGVLGFAVTALFALAVILLGVNLVRRLRRSQYRAEIQEELAAELAERDGIDRDPGASGADAESLREADPQSEDRRGPAGRPAGDAES